MVGVAQLVEPWIVIPVVVGSSPIAHPIARVAELVDALDLGSSGVTRESSSLSFRTITYREVYMQVTVEKTANLERHVKVVVPEGELKSLIDNKFGELRKQAKLPGFRPGKTPESVLQERFGLIGYECQNPSFF